jgi:hypothetical protein
MAADAAVDRRVALELCFVLRVALGEQDDAAAGIEIGERRQPGLADDRAEVAQHAARRLDRRLDRRRCLDLAVEEMAQHADAQAGGAARERRRRRRAGDRVEDQRAVLCGPRQGSGLGQCERHRHDAVARHQAARRLEARDAAERRRLADRAAGIRADAAGGKTCGDRRRSTAARAAGNARRVPRIARRRPRQVEGRPAIAELVKRMLAEDDGTRLLQPRDQRRVLRRNVILQQPRMRGRAHAGRRDRVLEAERHAVEATAPAGDGDRARRHLRRRACRFGSHSDVRIERGIEAGDAREHRLAPGERRQAAGSDPARAFGDREKREIAHA